jgi:mRNA interferase RelE/StbE
VPYTVRISPAAQRQFRALPTGVQDRIQPKIDALAQDPRPPGAKKLAAETELYRIRIGDHRVVYAIQDDALLVRVLAVGHRSDIYKRRSR